jgi:predicted nucleic acid-binding protein
VIVVDTNIIIYLILSSDFADLALEIRRKDKHWIAPMLWRSEFRNVSIGYLQRGSMSLSEVIDAYEMAERKVESRSVDGERVIELAAQSGCSAYDCEYVSLAERLDISLVSADKDLLSAFPDIAISMEDFLA